MRDAENIQRLADAGIADLMGMIFYPPSPRYVDKLPEELPSLRSLKRVGVFVDAPAIDIIRTMVRFHTTYIQLHGDESPMYIKRLRSRLDKLWTEALRQLPVTAVGSQPRKPQDCYRILKAFSVSSEEDLMKTAAYEECCDYFLFDTKCAEKGGSGKSFDWRILQAYHGHTPFLLSGGIGPESLEALTKFTHPQWAGVDLNSRFETSPGVKDITLLTDFCKQLRKIHH